MGSDTPVSEPAEPAETTPARTFEPLHRAERTWLRVGVAMLITFVVLAGVDAFRNSGGANSHGSTQIAPEKVSVTAPFDKPGTYQGKDGEWHAVVVAYAFGFLPREDLVVPVGVKVRFHVSSVDVVHGFQIPGATNVNLEVLPGHVSEAVQTFDKPGRYLILCHEYCGSGHHFMTAHIRVLKKGEDPASPPPLDDGTEASTSMHPGEIELHGADAHGDHA